MESETHKFRECLNGTRPPQEISGGGGMGGGAPPRLNSMGGAGRGAQPAQEMQGAAGGGRPHHNQGGSRMLDNELITRVGSWKQGRGSWKPGPGS